MPLGPVPAWTSVRSCRLDNDRPSAADTRAIVASTLLPCLRRCGWHLPYLASWVPNPALPSRRALQGFLQDLSAWHILVLPSADQLQHAAGLLGSQVHRWLALPPGPGQFDNKLTGSAEQLQASSTCWRGRRGPQGPTQLKCCCGRLQSTKAMWGAASFETAWRLGHFTRQTKRAAPRHAASCIQPGSHSAFPSRPALQDVLHVWSAVQVKWCPSWPDAACCQPSSWPLCSRGLPTLLTARSTANAGRTKTGRHQAQPLAERSCRAAAGPVSLEMRLMPPSRPDNVAAMWLQCGCIKAMQNAVSSCGAPTGGVDAAATFGACVQRQAKPPATSAQLGDAWVILRFDVACWRCCLRVAVQQHLYKSRDAAAGCVQQALRPLCSSRECQV